MSHSKERNAGGRRKDSLKNCTETCAENCVENCAEAGKLVGGRKAGRRTVGGGQEVRSGRLPGGRLFYSTIQVGVKLVSRRAEGWTVEEEAR